MHVKLLKDYQLGYNITQKHCTKDMRLTFSFITLSVITAEDLIMTEGLK